MAKLMTLMPGIYGVGQLLVKHWIDESGKYPSEHSGESDQQDSLLSQRRARRVILHAWPKTRFPNIRSGLLLFHPCFPRPPSRAVRLQITKHTHPISLFDVFFLFRSSVVRKEDVWNPRSWEFLHDSSIQERVLDDMQYGRGGNKGGEKHTRPHPRCFFVFSPPCR